MEAVSRLQDVGPVLPKFDPAILRERMALPDRFSAPIFALWDVTYRCTLRCAQCFNNSGDNRQEEATEEEALVIARQLAESGILAVCMSGGDALLHPAYFEAASLLKQAGVAVNTISNGWLVNDDAAERMAALFGAIEISVDGATSETHDFVRGRKGSFKRAFDAIERFGRRQKAVAVAFTPTLRNMSEFSRLAEVVSAIPNVERLVTGYLLPTGRAHINAELLPTRAQEEEFRREVYRLRDLYKHRLRIGFTDPIASERKLLRGKLPNPNVMISANGDIRVSPVVPIVFGNVLKDGLLHVWRESASGAWSDPLVRRYVDVQGITSFTREGSIVPWVDSSRHYRTLLEGAK